MIPKHCHLGDHRVHEKPASLYWAWKRADGQRVAYKQLVCASCARDHYAPVISAAMLSELLVCPACGIGTEDDYDAVYLTFFLPGAPRGQVEMPMCGPCAAELRSKAMRGATRLDDRGVGVGGPQPYTPTAVETWESLGIVPREVR